MPVSRKHKIAAVAATLAAAAGAGGAVAATQGGGGRTQRQAFLNDAAGRLHVSQGQLDSALQGAFLDRLNAAVKSGRITQAQANKIRQRVMSGNAMPFVRVGGWGRHARAGKLGPAAKYLGLTRKQLIADLRGGKTLAQVTTDQHKTVAGLEAALTAAAKTRLETAVANHRITAAQEQQILAKLPARLNTLVNRHWKARSHALHG